MKNKKFDLELFEETELVNFYTIRFEGNINTEFEDFLTRHKKGIFNKDMQRISYWIDKIGKQGALERNFRPESKMSDGVGAIPIDVSQLRLYCLRISDHILILGNGGCKTTKKYNEDSHLSNCVYVLSQLDRFIKARQRRNDIIIEGKIIKGYLTFFI
ncbi:MAG: hypothetical protein RBR62_01945 [Bacteroidales bacterium]|nr:hypothetical protein [Bacteroidales bacterium]